LEDHFEGVWYSCNIFVTSRPQYFLGCKIRPNVKKFILKGNILLIMIFSLFIIYKFQGRKLKKKSSNVHYGHSDLLSFGSQKIN
jgi:hypothetical protein